MNDNNLEAESAAPELSRDQVMEMLANGVVNEKGARWLRNGDHISLNLDDLTLFANKIGRAPAVSEDGLPRWIDDQKGKDPLMDDMIAYIIDLRAQLASERQAKEYEQQHAVESEKALAEMQAQLARQSQGEPGVERRRDLAHAPLPLDAEVALEHAALALDKAGDQGAHDHVVQVLAAHLPTEDTGGGAPD